MRAIVDHSRTILADKSGSFDWAAPFLPPDRRDDAAVVYAFCRLVDDIADETSDASRARSRLDTVRRELRGQTSRRPLVAGFCRVCHECDISLDYPLELLEGVTSDLGEVHVDDDRELLRYCYRVAGTVGLMMSPLLGVEERRATPHAVDLGVGMQLTNICRDVLEDANRGRVYLPRTRLEHAGTTPRALLDGAADRRAIARVVSGLLALADDYYRSGCQGLGYIPLRSRFAIRLASRVYRAHGGALRRRDCDALAGSVSVGPLDKASALLGATLDFLNPFGTNSRPPEHDSELHRPFADLPGANPPASRLEPT